MLGELEAELLETKDRVEREEAALDRSLADLKAQLMQLRSGAQVITPFGIKVVCPKFGPLFKVRTFTCKLKS